MTEFSTVSLDCDTGVIVLGVIAGVYSVISLLLLGTIIWCTCCRGKRNFQVRPLSPRNGYKSPRHSAAYPLPDEAEMRHLRITAQLEARRLKTISESPVASDGCDRVTVTKVLKKNSPFISRHAETNGGCRTAWEEKDPPEKDSSADGDPSEGSSSSSSMFINRNTSSMPSLLHEKSSNSSPSSQKESPSAHESRKRDAIIQRRRARRTDSTKPLLGDSCTSISESVDGDMSSSQMSLPSDSPATPTGTPSMRVLTRHAGSRKKRRTDSMRSAGSADGFESNTLPRMSHRLPPIASPRPLSSQAISPLQTLAENSTLNTESVLNLSSIERPRPTVPTSPGPSPLESSTLPRSRSKGPLSPVSPSPSTDSSTLPRLSLHLADDLGIEDRFKPMEDKFRSMV